MERTFDLANTPLLSRSPDGALAAGECCTFFVRPPLCRENLFLAVQRDGGSVQLLPFQKSAQGQSAVLALPHAGLYWAWLVWVNDTHILQADGYGSFAGNRPAQCEQLTVYDPAYTTPEWFSQGVVYHIFVDRFHRGSGMRMPRADGRTRVLHESWQELPVVCDDPQQVQNNDFFGGNLEGILQCLPYLHTLGVRTLYLSPIFEAASNHKYDTGDYRTIDPMFGDEALFTHLCAQAAGYGMRILLDAVLNHTGWDSMYFNRFARYPTVGAAQSLQSPYADWYTFSHFPDAYACWWNVPSLPAVNKLAAGYRALMLHPQSGVLRHWLRCGAAGYRLDVADELPQAFLEEVRTQVKAEKADALLLGEVWEDASNKISYGVRRQYFQGKELDGVMNYPLRTQVLQFLRGQCSAKEVAAALRTLYAHYPLPAQRCLLNVLGTHDTPRILTALAAEEGMFARPKSEKAGYRLSTEAYAHAIELLKLATVIQYMQPGAPCIYYGDEAGMEGFEDPLNRAPFPWGREDSGLTAWYTMLGALRTGETLLARGEIRLDACSDDVLLICRYAPEGEITALINRGVQPYPYHPPQDGILLLGQETQHRSGHLPALQAVMWKLERVCAILTER